MENPFNAVTAEYAQVRPAYPQPVVDLLAAGAYEVADIGAGTGKMTLLLAERGLHVTAIEPAAAMRAQLEQTLTAPARTSQVFSEIPGQASEIVDQKQLGPGQKPPAQTSLKTSRTTPEIQGYAWPIVHEATPVPGATVQDIGKGAVEVRAGTAEDTGLPDDSVDLAVFAQSWHWVDPEAASAEAARILRPGGRLVAVFNQLDVRIAWVKRLTRIMRSGDVHRPDRPPAFDHELFSTPSLELFEWTDQMLPEHVMALARTRSSWLGQDQAGREHMQNNLRWYLREHLGYGENDLITLPYVTLVWVSTVRKCQKNDDNEQSN